MEEQHLTRAAAIAARVLLNARSIPPRVRVAAIASMCAKGRFWTAIARKDAMPGCCRARTDLPINRSQAVPYAMAFCPVCHGRLLDIKRSPCIWRALGGISFMAVNVALLDGVGRRRRCVRGRIEYHGEDVRSQTTPGQGAFGRRAHLEVRR